MDRSVDDLMDLARPRADVLDRERIAAQVYSVVFGRGAPPVEIGRFVVESRLGSGGMGIVYRGYDPELDRRVAIKVLDLRRVSAEPALARARLQREARALAQLTHPNVVSVYDVGLLDEAKHGHDPRLYLVMEYVDGPTLRAWMRTEPELDARLALLLGAGRGLAAAHAANLVHGDFKPDNILVGADGRPRVADFGLALPILEFDPRDDSSDQSRDDSKEDSIEEHPILDDATFEESGVTISGVCGTPAYIAPEQLRGVRVDARADQFAFCVVACELLYGRRPFAGDSLQSLADAAMAGDRVALADRRIPRRVRAALLRGLSADPRHRFATMNELLRALERGFARRKRWRLGLAATLVVGALGLGVWSVQPDASEPTRSCVAAEARLEPVWNRKVAAAIEAGLQTADGRGGASAQMLLARLDAHAQSWAAAWTDSCVAQADDALSERMQVCLDARMLEFTAVVLALTDRADESDRPLASLDALTPVASCLDREALDAERPVPVEPERRRATELLRKEIVEADLASLSGRHDHAVSLSRRIVNEAAALDYRPIQAEAEYMMANVLLSAGQIDQAVAMAERAHLSAQASRHTTVLADAAILRVHLAYETANLDDGRAWLEQAKAATEAAGGDADQSVRLHASACMLELHAGAYDLAVEQCEQTQELIDRGARITTDLRVRVGVNFAIAEYGAGLLERADRRFAASAATIKADYGPEDPLLNRLMFNWGHVASARGDLDAALAHYRRALELSEQSPNPRDTLDCSIRVTIADVLRERGELDEAATAYADVLELAIAREDFWNIHVAKSGLALVAWAQGDAQAAYTAWSKQLADEREQLGPTHPWIIDLEVNIGAARAALGEVDRGLAQIDAAIAILEGEHGVDHVELIDDLQSRGGVARRAGRFEQCVADLNRAHALEQTRSGPISQALAIIEVERIACQIELGAAPVNLIAALEIVLETLANGPRRAAEASARVQLGRAYVAVDRRDEGRAQLERAATILRAEQGNHADDLALIAKHLDW